VALSTNTSFASPLGGILVVQTTSTATSDDNVTLTTSTLNVIEVTNGSNAVSYTKIWDSLQPTVGTSLPVIIFPVAAGATRTLNFMGLGWTSTSGVSMATVTAGGTGGTSTPVGGDVKVSLILS
jgi:hypothetical protein